MKNKTPKKDLSMLRELRGNAVQLQVPVTTKMPKHQLGQQHLSYNQNYYDDPDPEFIQVQRSVGDSGDDTPVIIMTQKEQQRAYVNAHGGGLIPPANFQDNPFTSYLKSVGATVGQTSLMQPSIDYDHEPKRTPLLQPKQKERTSSEQQSQSSRNQRQRQTQSLQPVKHHSQTIQHEQDANFSRIQLKEKMSRNVTQTIEHTTSDYKVKRRPMDILTSNLEPDEIKALRVANPLHHAFNYHLGKVITSVQHRRKFGDQESQMLALQDSNLSGNNLQMQVQSSDAFITQSQRGSQSFQLVPHESPSYELVPFGQNTPSRVIQDARREVQLANEQKKKLQVPKTHSLFKPGLKDEFVPQQRAMDQVASLLNRVNKNKDLNFIPMELEQTSELGGVNFRDAKSLDEVKGGQVVFTKNGFISVAPNKNQQTEVLKKEQYITEGVQQMMLNQVPFFRKFVALKNFKQWKKKAQKNLYERKRRELAKNYIFSKPIFASQFKELVVEANEVRFLKLIDTTTGRQYGKHQTHQYDSCSLECSNLSVKQLEKGLKRIWQILEQVKSFIKKDDKEFNEHLKDIEEVRIINEKHQEHILMTKAKAAKALEQEQLDLMKLRQNQFNSLVQLLSRVIFQNLSELLLTNKQQFTNMFTATKALTQFEVSLSLDQFGRLTTEPTPENHKKLFKKVFDQMEESIFKSYFLTAYFQDLVGMFFWEDKWTNPPGSLLMRRQITEVEQLVKEHPHYLSLDKQIAAQLNVDLDKLAETLEKYANIEEVYLFTHDWHERRERLAQRNEITGESQVSQEIEFYNQTWTKLHQLNGIIDKIPVSHTKLGTILLETASIKKSLGEMPKKIDESIRTNVTQTIDSETKNLKEELSSTSDTLDKIPSTLNVYVDQVNTLKYLKEKQAEFDKKMDTINRLQQQCKQDNIKISLKVQLNIEEVAVLHKNLPRLKEKAEIGLQENKTQIEISMFRSSEGLSLKIKAFEKKYVETYLQDKTRLERCKETLDELLRRSQAVLEMKSKVVLYKEFLKILYEDDPQRDEKLKYRKLSCATDCEFMEEIHKNTIKMWKVLFYWVKKRHQCFTTPFLEFDLKIILKAISKVTKFLADQSKQSEVVAFKAQPITRAVNVQVKDTSVIVEFVKEMNKDTLKRRHWAQIFSLLKAPHLRNSTAFTIVDLREYNIQNNANDVRVIIEHANTESKYENVFLTIREEWEQSQLKVIPFKEQINDYILVSTDLMSDAIEDNLSTLDTIARSKYAQHVTEEINELIKKLRTMLEHLLLWTQAQKYWLTLDPIYNSGLFRNFFGEHTQDFLDTRASFRRIMWSSFRRPKTTYNLMIRDRMPVFQHLIHFYAMIQKQTNSFLEQKRLNFSRFYFLNDSQFLDMLMLVNSNQDYQVYTNLLFTGVQKMFVTRLLQEDDVEKQKTLMHQYEQDEAVEPNYLEDLEGQLERFINQGRKRAIEENSVAQNMIQYREQERLALEQDPLLVDQFNYEKLDGILAKPVFDSQLQKRQEEMKGDSENFHQHPGDIIALQVEDLSQKNASEKEASVGFDGESFTKEDKMSENQSEAEHLQVYRDIVAQKQQLFNLRSKNLAMQNSTQDFIALGFVSLNKELFLFDQHVSMSKPIESWLSETELAMQDSLRKQMIDSIENFTTEPIEEWILDYPQQVSLTTIHLILSQEVSDILQNIEQQLQPQQQQQQQPEKKEGEEEEKTAENNKEANKDANKQGLPNTIAKGYEELAIQIGVKDEKAGQKKRRANQTNEEKKLQKIIRKKPTMEPEDDPDEQQVLFLDETFGQEAVIEEALDEAVKIMKRDDKYAQNSKKSQLNVRKADYKEQVLQVLQHKGLNSLALRLTFWINKMTKLMYKPKQGLFDPEELKSCIELPGISKMRVKSMVLFMLHQKEQVETLIQLKVQNVNDFEWQSKLRMQWSQESEAQAVCGGWSLSLGYEYLGSSQRLMLTPLSERYFVYMSSCLREKHATLLNCSQYETTATEIVQELANLCMLPYKQHQCVANNNLSSLTQLLNGAAMANTWVFFEHFDNLQIEKLQIIVKEIQLLQEQFIVSGFSRNLMKERIAKQSGISLTQISSASLAGANQRNQMVTLGIFASTRHTLSAVKESESYKQFYQSLRSTFRSISLAKPSVSPMILNFFFSENFVEYKAAAQLFYSISSRFFDLKQQHIKESVEQGFQKGMDQFDYTSLKQCIKMITVLRNQEFDVYYQTALEDQKLKKQQFIDSGVERRDAWVVPNDLGTYDIKNKLRETWIKERQDNLRAQQEVDNKRFQLELDSMGEALKQMCVDRFLPEFMSEEQYQQVHKRNRKAKYVNINIKELEDKIETLVCQAFTEVVDEIVKKDAIVEKERIKAAKLMASGPTVDTSFGKADGGKEATQLATGEKLIQTREKMCLLQRSNLAYYTIKLKTTKQHQEETNLLTQIEQQKLQEEEILKKMKKKQENEEGEEEEQEQEQNNEAGDGGRESAQSKIGSAPLRPLLRHKSTIKQTYLEQKQEAEDKIMLLFQHGLRQVAEDLHFDLTQEQVYNCMGVLEAMKRSKGIIITGPICSGKTQTIKLVTLALKKTLDTTLRTSYISPDTFSDEHLFGPVLAYDQSSLQQMDQPLQPQSVFQIILQNYNREKKLLNQQERDKLIQAFYIDQQELSHNVADSFRSYLQQTNLRLRDYLTDQEYLLDFTNEEHKVHPNQVQQVAVRFPNGNVTQFSSDLFFFFETQSLRHASPAFLREVQVVNLQQDDVLYIHIFYYKIKLLEKKHTLKLKDYGVDFRNIKECLKDFAIPFIRNLNRSADLTTWSLWDIKSLTLQFFNQLDAQLYKLEEWAAYYRMLDDGSFPIEDVQKDTCWNIVLTSVVWSYGAVLSKDLRQTFDDQFGMFRSKFNITFNVATKMKFKLFDIFYDIQKLTWAIFTDKLEYKLKSYFEPALQALLLPTQQISQAFFMLDTQVSYMKADKALDKAFRIVGPSSSSKTVILNTFAAKMKAASHSVSVPMSAYLTLDLFKERVEENYRKKRENSLVPRDQSKQLLLIIDDVHLQQNLNVELLEFIRSWSFCRGYFSVDKSCFKKVADFGCIMAQNSKFQSNTKKKDRFLYYSTTLYNEEIGVDQYKVFIQSWLTSQFWPVSQLISKYYLLISNALMSLIDRMRENENIINNFSFANITSFQFVAKFCANLVSNTSLTDGKADVYGVTAEGNARKEEEAVADLFCYEIIRTFGDRLMRPTAKQFLLDKLSLIVQREFLCEENYNGAYLEQLVMGDYHQKDEGAHHKLKSIMTHFMREEAESMIRAKVKKLSGNAFLPQLLDAPQGLADCYRISRILYKPQQHLILLGQPGVSKLEMVQLAAITNNAPLLQIEASTYSEPLQFAYNLRQILLTVAKINKSSYIVVNDQAVRDPLYFDYIYNFLSQLSRHESFVMFDDQFFIDLAAIEAQHIKKLEKVQVPDEYTLFKQAVNKLQKHAHFVYILSDLLSYKEIVQMWPQTEYLFEVMFMEDLTQQDYVDYASKYLRRVQVSEELLGENNNFASALVDTRARLKTQWLQKFYSQNMLKFTIVEQYATRGASEFIFNDGEKLQGNIFLDSRGYQVADPDLTQTLLNMPVEVTMLNKHRFGVFCEVTKFLFDLLSMHLSSKKSYYETFLAKSKQFHKYFASVKESKRGLHDDQQNHSFRVAMATDKIKNIQQQLVDKHDIIGKKRTEILELEEELQLAEQEVETVIIEKNWKLDQTIAGLKKQTKAEFINIAHQTKLSELELHLYKLLNHVVTMEHEIIFSKKEALSVFSNKEELLDILDNRRNEQFSRPIFERLQDFSSSRSALEYNDNSITSLLFTYLSELYRKLNIKNTMQSTFARIKEIRNQIDSNVFSIQYSQQSIEAKNHELKIQQRKLQDLQQMGTKLSKKIEEAELSYMRTDQIFKNINEYSSRMEHKLASITSRSQTLLGDSIVLGASVVYMGVFAPEEREQFRAHIIDYLMKMRNIVCNKIWTDFSSNLTAIPTKSMFLQVLKDLGLRDILYKHNMPGVLSNHQFCESLFGMLFAPSCPVVCDPTGVMEEFVREKLLADMDPQTISGTDIEAGKKLAQNMASNKPSIVTDVNTHNSDNTGYTVPHGLMKTLANPLYNGVDFDPKRLGQAKKIGSIGSFMTHATGQNKRIPILSAALEHVSLYQAQIFQPRFEFQMNADFVQNATFICAAPSLVVESRLKLEENGAIVKLKELIMERILPDAYDFIETKKAIKELNRRILRLERTFENSFLIASGETFKNIGEYSSLRSSIEDIISAREEKEEHLKNYRMILKRVKLVTEASDVLYQMYLVLKIVAKQCNLVTYSWSKYLEVVDSLLVKIVDNLKLEAIKGQKGEQEELLKDVEIEIDNSFFKRKFVPAVHQACVASIDGEIVPLFNFFLSLRLAQTYKAISATEHQFIIKQLTELKGYKQWRQPSHSFVKLDDVIDKQRLSSLRRELLRLYPDLARPVFDLVEKTLGTQFKYIDASIFIQKDLKEKYHLSQVQQLTFGFLCPDNEFKSKLTLFMYTQNMATFDFTEEVTAFGDYLLSADFFMPIALKSESKINPINLITTLAHAQQRNLVVLRADPSYQNHKFSTSVFNLKLSEKINSQLMDYSLVRQKARSCVDQRSVLEQSEIRIDDKEILAKQLWLQVKQRDVNLDEGRIFFIDTTTQTKEEGGDSFDAKNPHVAQICEAARQGNWILLVPVQFPHFMPKLIERLQQMKSGGEINSGFRLIVDLQNYKNNEIPDQFLFNQAASFILSEANHDRVITLGDIWSKILNPALLERLTDVEEGNNELKKIEFAPETAIMQRNPQFMQVFSNEVKDENSIQLFNKFIERSTIEFTNKLKFQRVQTLERMKAQKEAELEKAREEELKKQKEEEEARARLRIEEKQESDLKSVTASERASHLRQSQMKEEDPEPSRPQTSLELQQEVAAINLAAQVAAVNEQEGARLDYEMQEMQANQQQESERNESAKSETPDSPNAK